eukprot:GHVN01013185.1.p1 GENE.GHVN01013185.1~~GHVN01013185.1.p1  ORF type:complete len:703 (-),score=77.10 GHVN01013185.1:2066-4096(-)
MTTTEKPNYRRFVSGTSMYDGERAERLASSNRLGSSYVPAEQVTAYTECSAFTIVVGIVSCVGLVICYVLNGELQRIITMGSGVPVYFVIWFAHAFQGLVIIPVSIYIAIFKYKRGDPCCQSASTQQMPQHPAIKPGPNDPFQPDTYTQMQIDLRRALSDLNRGSIVTQRSTVGLRRVRTTTALEQDEKGEVATHEVEMTERVHTDAGTVWGDALVRTTPFHGSAAGEALLNDDTRTNREGGYGGCEGGCASKKWCCASCSTWISSVRLWWKDNFSLSFLGLDEMVEECVGYETFQIILFKVIYLTFLYMVNAWAWSASLDQPDLSVGVVTALFNTTPIWVFLFTLAMDYYNHQTLNNKVEHQGLDDAGSLLGDVEGGEGERESIRGDEERSHGEKSPEVCIQIVAIILAMIGVMLLTFQTEPARDLGIGIILVLFASAAYSAYEVLYKRDLLNNHSTVPLWFVLLIVGLMGLIIGCLLWWPIVILHYSGIEPFRLPSQREWIWLLANAVFLTFFQICLQLSLCFLPSPLLVSLASLLTMPVAQLTDWFLRTGNLTSAAILGSVFIGLSFVIMVGLEVRKASDASKVLAEYRLYMASRYACLNPRETVMRSGSSLGDDDLVDFVGFNPEVDGLQHVEGDGLTETVNQHNQLSSGKCKCGMEKERERAEMIAPAVGM